MTIRDLTRDELLSILRQIETSNIVADGKYHISAALRRINHKREQERLAEADECIRISAEANKRYIELLKPYGGMRYIDIPFEILQQASAAAKEAREADRRYNELTRGL